MTANEPSKALQNGDTGPRRSSVEEWWAQKTRPSRQRGLTQPQRDSLAGQLKHSRRERRRWDEMKADLSEADLQALPPDVTRFT